MALCAHSLLVACLLVLCDGLLRLSNPQQRALRRELACTQQSRTRLHSTPTDESSLWKDRVEFVDLSSAPLEPSSTARPLPLFLLGGAFFPEGVTVLNVFEMKYRTMMFDCANADDMFGYFYTDGSGRIGLVGTLCKIVDRRLLEDGRQIIQIEGVGRCKIRRILKTLPYVQAEVEPLVVDDAPSGGEAAATKLEIEVWDAVKYYMRLMRSYEPNKDMVVTSSLKRSRPTRDCEADPRNAQRRTSFSFALANMISMSSAAESQLMLQTTNVMKRLRAEKMILTQAAEGIAEQLIAMNLISAAGRDGIKARTSATDDDDDVLPRDTLQKVVTEEKDEWDISNIE